MEIKTSKDYHQTEKGKRRKQCTHTLKIHKGRLVGYRSVFNHIQEAGKLPESYKALEKAGFHFADYILKDKT